MASFFTDTFRLADLTPQFVQDTYLTGLLLLGADGKPVKPSFYEFHLNAALNKLREVAHVDILKKQYLAEQHDYHLTDYVNFAFLKTFHQPVLSVEQIRAVYPSGSPTSSVQVFPSEWVKLEAGSGQINLVPQSGSSLIFLQGGSWLPMIYGGLSTLPLMWEIDYTAGIDEQSIPHLIVDTICKWAVVSMLTIMSDTTRPLGVTSQSTSVDGLSQSRSFTVPAFKARIDEYKADLGLPLPPAGRDLTAGQIRQVRDSYYGINFAVA